MKKICCLVGGICLLVVFYSCGDKKNSFDRSLIPGKWNEGTLFERYFSDGTGYTWDEGDDVKEDEAQKFEWTLEKDGLTQIHLGDMGLKVPKSYTVTELTLSSFKYKDSHGKSYSFKKVD